MAAAPVGDPKESRFLYVPSTWRDVQLARLGIPRGGSLTLSCATSTQWPPYIGEPLRVLLPPLQGCEKKKKEVHPGEDFYMANFGQHMGAAIRWSAKGVGKKRKAKIYTPYRVALFIAFSTWLNWLQNFLSHYILPHIVISREGYPLWTLK